MTSKFIDLLLLAEGVVLLFLAIALEASPAAVRVVLGLMFVLFSPGYALIAALFPRRQDLEPVERVALSFGLSLAIVPLAGLALNYTPWGIRLWPILISLTIFVALCLLVAAYRRRRLPDDQAFVIEIPQTLTQRRRLNILSSIPPLLVAASVIALGVVVYVAATSHRGGEKFTEFYVLGPSGKAEGYPKSLQLGEEARVILGVVNHEGRASTYRVESRFAGELPAKRLTLSLEDGQRQEFPFSISPRSAGERQRLDFQLFLDGDVEPYRSLHLFIDVNALLPAPTAAPRNSVVRPAAPSNPANPSPTPLSITAEGLLHVAQAGETPASVASRYGLPPAALVKLNGRQPGDALAEGEAVVVPGIIYTVVNGDTVWEIAGGAQSQVARWAGLSSLSREVDADRSRFAKLVTDSSF